MASLGYLLSLLVVATLLAAAGCSDEIATPDFDDPESMPTKQQSNQASKTQVPSSFPKLNAGMVLVPAGEFPMGAEPTEREALQQFGFSVTWIDHVSPLLASASTTCDTIIKTIFAVMIIRPHPSRAGTCESPEPDD